MTTTYLGYDVLEVSPNARETPEDTFGRLLVEHDPGPGKRYVSPRDDAPKIGRTMLYTCQNRIQIAALRTFLLARRGRAIPFWMPSIRRDLILDAVVASSAVGITIGRIGYTRHLYPQQARRHLAFWTGTSWVYRSVTSATESTSTEALGLSSALGAALDAGALVSQLLFCRLNADEIDIPYITDSIAETSIPYIEIPTEAP